MEAIEPGFRDDDTIPSTPYTPRSPFAPAGMTSAVYRRVPSARSDEALVRRTRFAEWAHAFTALLEHAAQRLARALRRLGPR